MNIANNKQVTDFRVLDMRMGLAERLGRNLTSYALLAFCIWLSHDSTFWTLVCGLIFLAGFSVQIASFTRERTNTFRSVQELKDWANSL